MHSPAKPPLNKIAITLKPLAKADTMKECGPELRGSKYRSPPLACRTALCLSQNRRFRRVGKE